MTETLPPALPLDVIEPDVMERRAAVLGALPETGVDLTTVAGILVALVVLVLGAHMILAGRRSMEGSGA